MENRNLFFMCSKFRKPLPILRSLTFLFIDSIGPFESLELYIPPEPIRDVIINEFVIESRCALRSAAKRIKTHSWSYSRTV